MRNSCTHHGSREQLRAEVPHDPCPPHSNTSLWTSTLSLALTLPNVATVKARVQSLVGIATVRTRATPDGRMGENILRRHIWRVSTFETCCLQEESTFGKSLQGSGVVTGLGRVGTTTKTLCFPGLMQDVTIETIMKNKLRAADTGYSKQHSA